MKNTLNPLYYYFLLNNISGKEENYMILPPNFDLNEYNYFSLETR
jgi:hypothetical protein